MRVVGKPVRKKDAMALVTGKPVFTNDMAPKDCLIVKLLRSPYAMERCATGAFYQCGTDLS